MLLKNIYRRSFAEKLFIYNIVIMIVISSLIGIISIYLRESLIINTDLIIAPLRYWLSPKPFEELAFKVNVVAVFIFSLCYIFFKNYSEIKIKNNNLSKICALLILLPPFYVLVENLQLINFVVLVLWAIFSVILYKSAEYTFIYEVKPMKYGKYIFIILLMMTFLSIISWRIYSINHVNNIEWQYWVDDDAVIFPLSQVISGKHILVDLPSQYGLYPELLSPIFKLVGTTVLSFTMVMSILLFIAYVCIFFVLLKIKLNKFLFLFGGISLICLTAENYLFLLGKFEPVFQVWPIRFFWPAVSIIVFYNFIQNKDFKSAFFMSILSCIAIFWNLETGLAVVISYSGYLIFNFIIAASGNKSVMRCMIRNCIMLHIITFVTCIILYIIFIVSYSSHLPNFSLLFYYQKIFYKVGFGMIDIPKSPSLWMVVIAMYLYGLSYSSYTMRNMNSSVKNDLVFYLSLLGIGLFIYYEGRSHIYNLPKVAWPAFLIALIFSDGVIRMLKLRIIDRFYIYCVSLFIAFIFAISIIFIIKIPYMYSSYTNQLTYFSQKYDAVTMDEIIFIKTHLPSNKVCLIVSKNQGIYSFELNIKSPLAGPGLVQILLQSDLNGFIAQIYAKQPQCVFLGDKQSLYDLGANYNKIFANYKIVAINKYKTMYFLQPKN